MSHYIDRFGELKLINPFREFWYRYENHPSALFGLLIFSMIILLFLLSPILAPYDVNHQFKDHIMVPPSWLSGGEINFLLGTDELGRDIFSRLLIGGATTISGAFLAVFMAAIVGISLAIFTTLTGSWLNRITIYIFDVLLTFPILIIALLIISIIGKSLHHSILAISIAMIPHFYKSLSNAISLEINKPYYIAAKLDGASGFTLLFSVLMPNILGAIIIHLSLSLSTAIIEIATLGFLGFGAQSLQPEWGAMIGNARSFIFQAPWSVWVPGIAIFISVLAIHLVSNGIKDSLSKDKY